MQEPSLDPSPPPDIDIGVAVLLRNEAGQFPAIQRSDSGKIQCAAGFLQEGEVPGAPTPDDPLCFTPDEARAAARELEEETGIRVDPNDLVPLHVTATRRSRRFVFFALPPGRPWTQGPPLTPTEGQAVWTDAATLQATHYTNGAALDAWAALFPTSA